LSDLIMFDDCALPDACECRVRIQPEWQIVSCLVPEINRTARQFGWRVPYPEARESNREGS
jgi:hypothetical protein